MLLPTVLLAVILAAPASAPGREAGLAIATLPDEPGAIVLPAASILQAVAADLDGDERRELVRLVRGAEDAVLAEVWGVEPDGWQLRGAPVEAVPPSRIGTRIDPVYQATPVRLLVRRVAGAERVTVASQPHFEEIDVGPACCLILHDLGIEDGAATLRSVAEASDFSDAIIVIDLDGDGTDELLSTRSLPPEGDIGYPIDARVHRWSGAAFDRPTETRLGIGSGDSPFRLGDSDGVPGEEAAIISTLGPPGLFRMRLGADDRLELDAAGFVVEQALAVPLADGRGIAAVGPVIGLMTAAWPPGEPVDAPVAESSTTDARILGAVAVAGLPRLVVHERATNAVRMLGLPTLLPSQATTLDGSPAAQNLSPLPFRPFSGPLPGGGPDGRATIIHAGRLIPSSDDPGASGTSLMATLAGAEPIGLVGDGELIALHHGPIGVPAPGPAGGALVVPPALDQAWTSIAPFELARQPEGEDGELHPALGGAVRLDARSGIAAGRDGFIADVTAPAGSRVFLTELDPSGLSAPLVVPDTGRLGARFIPSAAAIETPRYPATLQVLTPAGHSYLATFEVHLRTEPPPLNLDVTTPLGSSGVEISGRTVPYAEVRVDGRVVALDPRGAFAATIDLPPWPTEVLVEVDDQLGNVARRTVSGIGLFDYRGLPWVPITGALVAVVGIVLFLRVPRSSPPARRADDDAGLEELEPD